MCSGAVAKAWLDPVDATSKLGFSAFLGPCDLGNSPPRDCTFHSKLMLICSHKATVSRAISALARASCARLRRLILYNCILIPDPNFIDMFGVCRVGKEFEHLHHNFALHVHLSLMCAGDGFTGAQCCGEGLLCAFETPTLYSCIPESAPPPQCADVWRQCGGACVDNQQLAAEGCFPILNG